MADSNVTPLRSISPAFMAVYRSSSAEEDWTDTNAYWKTLNPFALEKRVAPGWISSML